MKVLDLFSGIGGFSIGLEKAGMKTITFCEIEEYPSKILKKHWPGIPIARDVRLLSYREGILYEGDEPIYRGTIDVICGGFPCQDLSVAGKQAGIEAERSGLWSEFARLISEIRPRFAIVENVTALLSGPSGRPGRWFGRVLGDLAEIGFDAEWHCIPASELGAHHHRDRVWIMAYPNRSHLARDRMSGRVQKEKPDINSGGGDWLTRENVAYPTGSRQQGQGKVEQSLFAEAYREGKTINAFSGGTPEIWQVEPELGRVADGVPDRSHKLKALGNAVVPQIPEIIGNAIISASTISPATDHR